MEAPYVFGERRPYLFMRDVVNEARPISSYNTDLTEKASHHWTNDAHAYRFSSREGSYSLIANNPVGPDMESFHGINVIVQMILSNGQPEMMSSLFSEGDVVSTSTMNQYGKIKTMLPWLWAEFSALRKIVKHTVIMLFQTKVYFWCRFETPSNKSNRQFTKTEEILESVFRKYLQFLVEQSPHPLTLKYLPGGLATLPNGIFASSVSQYSSRETEHIELKILTPLFFTRFIHYAHDFEAIFCELTEACTIWVDKPEALTRIFLKKISPTLNTFSMTDFVHFKLIQVLRRRPVKIQQSTPSAQTKMQPTTQATDIRDFRISSMDAFVLEHCEEPQKLSYRSTVARIFVANQYLMGNTRLLYFMELLLRIIISWCAVLCLVRGS